MADIELVIKIPEEDFKKICANKEDAIIAHDTCRRIANGTPLPKGHGDLIDRKALLHRPYEVCGFVEWYDEIKYATPIIEADKGE